MSTLVRRSAWREAVEVLVCALVLALFTRTWLVQAFSVPSDSMAPNLMTGDHVLVNKFVFAPSAAWLPGRAIRRNDLVVFRLPDSPREILVKRCVALGGDRVELRDKQLVVNDREVVEPWVEYRDPHVYPRSRFAPRGLRTRDNFGPIRVPADHLFCLGDNRDESRDSRSFGSIPRDRVLGRPLLVYWSVADRDPSEPAGSAFARSRLGLLFDRLADYLSPRRERLLRWAR